MYKKLRKNVRITTIDVSNKRNNRGEKRKSSEESNDKRYSRDHFQHCSNS